MRPWLVALSLGALSAAHLGSPSTARAARHFTLEDALALERVSDPRLSPEGEWVAYVVRGLDLDEDRATSAIFMAPFEGGSAVRLTTAESSNTRPRFSPDGRYLAFLSSRVEERAQVFLLDRRGGEPRGLSSLEGGVSDFAWSPDGSALVLVAKDPKPEPKKTGEDEEETPPPLVITRLQFKRDGAGYLDERRSHLYVLDVSTGGLRQITQGPYDDSEPAWSPDGREIAFVSNRTEEPDANDNTDIFLVPSGGGEPRRLTDNPGADRAPAWSPDGRFVAHLSVREPEIIWYALEELAVVNADGGEARVLTASLDRNVRRLQFSTDGEHVLFLIEDEGSEHLARVSVSGGEIERLVAGERDVEAFDAGAGGRAALLISEPHLPSEVFTWSGGALERLSHVNDARLAEVELGAVENVHFESEDGTPLEGFVTKPPGFEAGRRYPTILWIHGGPVSQFSTSFDAIWQVFAGAGYVVVSANPRGSSGYGRDFSHAIWADWGNKDFEDVIAAVDHAIELGYADPDRLGVGGWSYGGILTNYVITQTDRFRAAISGASETNFLACYGTDHYQHEWETELGLPWENRELYIELSPLTRVANIVTPTLILCGEHDWNVPLNQSEQLYQSLRRRGVETTLIIYPGESHTISKPSYQKDRYERYLAWYGKYLGAAEAPPTLQQP